MKHLLTFLTLSLIAVTGFAKKPNFVIIMTDDQGYNDLSCYGSKKIKTPHVDKMAKEGRKFTSYYVASNVCTPSRAALLTGAYPQTVGMHNGVLFPQDNAGLHPEEVTIADMLKTADYKTACIGKWHLGHRKPFLPTKQGFDYYYGIPYSNDMNHPKNQHKPRDIRDGSWKNQDAFVAKWKTPLIENEEIIEIPVNQRTITRRYTDKAIEFIKTNKDEPFFLYLPHSMPHIPLFVPEDVYDPNPKNAYTCVIEHVDAEVGRLMDTLRELKLSENTYVIFTSDNGPWLPFRNHGGSAHPLRDGKGTVFEGGHRVPFVLWGPGRVPAGSETDAMVAAMDLLPTIAKLAGVTPEPRGPIDGLDVSEVFHGKDESPRNEFLFYTRRGQPVGIRVGNMKFLKLKNKLHLYDLENDIGERKNLATEQPEKTQQLADRFTELSAKIRNQTRRRATAPNPDNP